MNEDIVFGAIRWDATFCPTGTGANIVRSLSTPRYQYRAPARATVRNTRNLTWTATQTDMDNEIAEAAQGKISYWAFLRYGTGSDMNNGFNLYASSTAKTVNGWTVRYASMEQTNTLGTTGTYTTQVSRLVTEMQTSYYQKVLTNRPLMYLYYSSGDITGYWGGNIANLKTCLDLIRTNAQAAGLGNPYIVLVGGSPNMGTVATSLAVDAVTNYISLIPDTLKGAYTGLTATAESYWATLAAAYSKIVPICMAGWDRRPRIERPVSWEYSTQTPFRSWSKYTVTATPAEIATHVSNAITYIRNNPSVCDSKAILCYAWNEVDEGGWLQKTIGDTSGARLTALAGVLGI